MYEHHRRLFLETETTIYYINSLGFFEKYEKPNDDKEDINEKNLIKLKGSYDYVRKIYKINIHKTTYNVKHEILKYFSRQWRESTQRLITIHKDHDFRNCNIENLILLTEKQYDRKRRGHIIVVTPKSVDEGIGKVFYSMVEIANELHIDHSTLIRHINNKERSPYLFQFKFEIIKRG